MRYLVITSFLVLFSSPFSDDGEKDGRRGNELYEQKDYALAAEAYRSGLSSLDEDAPARLRYGLENNLGAALLKDGRAADANEAFARALAAAPEPFDIARTAYNAGNAAFSANKLEQSLAHYRESLLRDPDNVDAKFNYEFVKRKLDQQREQQQQQQGDDQGENQQKDDGQEPGDQDQQEPQSQDQQRQDGGEEQQQQGEQPDQRQDEQPQPKETPEKLSEEQAQRILQALQNEEEQLLRQVQRQNARPRSVEKDW